MQTIFFFVYLHQESYITFSSHFSNIEVTNNDVLESESRLIADSTTSTAITDITTGQSKSLLQLVSEAEESEPIESMKLRKAEEHQQQQESSNNEGTGTGTVNTVLKSNSNRLSKELRCELAVTAVKRAFSQCPNLSLLVSPSLYNLSSAISLRVISH